MNEIQVFNYNSKIVRTVDINGEVWFVAKDVADILDFRDAFNAVRGLDDDEKGTQKMSTPSGMQEMTVISEPGLYDLVLRSNKPEAKKFSRWVRHEVLPQIRKTGSFLSHEDEQLTDSIMFAAKMIFDAAGFKANQLALALDKVAAHYVGHSLLNLSGFVLEAPTKKQILNPKDIGKFFGVSAREVNTKLIEAGYQKRVGRDYEPLELGEPFAIMVDVNKWHNSGSPVRHLKWDSSILNEVADLFNKLPLEDI